MQLMVWCCIERKCYENLSSNLIAGLAQTRPSSEQGETNANTTKRWICLLTQCVAISISAFSDPFRQHVDHCTSCKFFLLSGIMSTTSFFFGVAGTNPIKIHLDEAMVDAKQFSDPRFDSKQFTDPRRKGDDFLDFFVKHFKYIHSSTKPTKNVPTSKKGWCNHILSESNGLIFHFFHQYAREMKHLNSEFNGSLFFHLRTSSYFTTLLGPVHCITEARLAKEASSKETSFIIDGKRNSSSNTRDAGEVLIAVQKKRSPPENKEKIEGTNVKWSIESAKQKIMPFPSSGTPARGKQDEVENRTQSSHFPSKGKKGGPKKQTYIDRIHELLKYFCNDGVSSIAMKDYDDVWKRCHVIYGIHRESLTHASQSSKDEDMPSQNLMVLYLSLASVVKFDQTEVQSDCLQKKIFHELQESMDNFDWDGSSIGNILAHLLDQFKLLRSDVFRSTMINAVRKKPSNCYREGCTDINLIKRICTGIDKDLSRVAGRTEGSHGASSQGTQSSHFPPKGEIGSPKKLSSINWLPDLLKFFCNDGVSSIAMKEYFDVWERCSAIFGIHRESFTNASQSSKEEEDVVKQNLMVLYFSLASVVKFDQTEVQSDCLQKKIFHELQDSMDNFDWDGSSTGNILVHLLDKFKLLRSDVFRSTMIKSARKTMSNCYREGCMDSKLIKSICTGIDKDLSRVAQGL